MDILAIEDMEHADALEFTRDTDQRFVQIRDLTKQKCQLQALKVTILAEWQDTKDETPLRNHTETKWQFTMGLSSEETVSSFQKYCD